MGYNHSFSVPESFECGYTTQSLSLCSKLYLHMNQLASES